MPLTAKDPAGTWIADFEKSDDPKFKGKSKEERKKMALGAYYGAVKESAEPHPLLEYTIEKTKRGVRVVHNGKVVHVTKSADNAQEWIARQAVNENQESSTKMTAEKIVLACMEKNFLSAEAAFKSIVAEKVTSFLQGHRAVVAQKMVTESESGVVVKVHKAYPGKIEAIHNDLKKYHSDNGADIHHETHGDYVHFNVANKPHNSADAVKKTLQSHSDHPAYAGVHESVQPVNESMRLLGTHKSDDGKHTAKVYKDTEWGEHRVRFFTDGKHHVDADYHTEDKADADDTAKAEIKRMAKGSK